MVVTLINFEANAYFLQCKAEQRNRNLSCVIRSFKYPYKPNLHLRMSDLHLSLVGYLLDISHVGFRDPQVINPWNSTHDLNVRTLLIQGKILTAFLFLKQK